MSESVQPVLSAANLSDSEAQRLAAVFAHGILDTEPEPEFDAIARLAGRLFAAPMAFVGLFDADRFWIKAAVGLETPELVRDASLITQQLAGASFAPMFEDLAGSDGKTASIANVWALRSFAAAPVVDAGGHLLGAVAILDHRPRADDDTQRGALEDVATLALSTLLARQRGRLLHQLAQTDPLTGAADALQFEQALDVELRHAMRTGESFAVLRLDLDGFADINTAYGQAAGDAVLREVGRRLHQQVRNGDLLARLGSDDFGIVMRHGGDEQAKMLADRIMAAVRQPIKLGSGGEQVSAGLSIGFATYSDNIASIVDLLAQAEAALKQARLLKESRWMVFGKLFNGPELKLVGQGD